MIRRTRHTDDSTKPKNNRVMCPDCLKQKMLFETERKALDFIKWNAGEIEHGESLRAYYCPACCGWHISHKEYKRNYGNSTERLLMAYRKAKKGKGRIDRLIKNAREDD